jgi:ParB/RepB/Spo0J family partition protein
MRKQTTPGKSDSRKGDSRRRNPNQTREALAQLFPVFEGQRDVVGLKMIKREQIIVREQVRKNAQEANIDDLRENITEFHKRGLGIEGSGILQALIVRPATPEETREAFGEEREGFFILIFGERRFHASDRLLDELPCIVVASSKGADLVMQIVENNQREDVSPLDEARAMQMVREQQGISIRDLAALIGKGGKGYVENRLGLLSAGKDVQQMVSARTDTLIHARYIDKVQDAKLRRELIKEAQSGGSAAQLRQRIAQESSEKEKNAAIGSTPKSAPLSPGKRSEKILEHLFSGKLALDRALAVVSDHGQPSEEQLRAIDNEVKALEERTQSLRKAIPALAKLEPTRRSLKMVG